MATFLNGYNEVDMKNIITKKYAELCQVLGDLKYKKTQLDQKIKQIESEIYGLNFVNELVVQEEILNSIKNNKSEE